MERKGRARGGGGGEDGTCTTPQRQGWHARMAKTIAGRRGNLSAAATPRDSRRVTPRTRAGVVTNGTSRRHGPESDLEVTKSLPLVAGSFGITYHSGGRREGPPKDGCKRPLLLPLHYAHTQLHIHTIQYTQTQREHQRRVARGEVPSESKRSPGAAKLATSRARAVQGIHEVSLITGRYVGKGARARTAGCVT